MKIIEQFTRLPNDIFKKILISDIKKRERKALDLIIRLSYGCNENDCTVIKADFETVGIGSEKIKKVLDSLENRKIIIIERHSKNLIIEINNNINQWEVKINGKEEKLAKLVGKNLSKRESESYQNDIDNTTKIVDQNPNNYPTISKDQYTKDKFKDKFKDKLNTRSISSKDGLDSKIDQGPQSTKDLIGERKNNKIFTNDDDMKKLKDAYYKEKRSNH